MRNLVRPDPRYQTKADWVLATFSERPLLWIALLWLLLVMPGLTLRGAYFEEQTVLGLARGAIEDGWWLSPHLYGQRFVERPVLLSWITALLSWPFGTVIVPLCRLPTAISGLVTALLVYGLVARRSSVVSGLVAALCFMASPIIFQKAFLAEPDLLLTALMFAGFVVWWQGEENNRVSLPRWLAVSFFMTAAGMTKGPQPLAFFYIGVFAYYAIFRRDVRPILGLILVGIIPAAVMLAWYYAVYAPGDLALWEHHSRLALWHNGIVTELQRILDLTVRFLVATLPCVLILVFARRSFDNTSRNAKLIAALLFYAGLCTLVLWFWPGARYRYAMPAAPAFAAAAGLLFDQLSARRNEARYVALYAIAALMIFQFTLNWLVMPSVPQLFAESRFSGRAVAAVMATAPAPLYDARAAANYTLLLYVPPPIRAIGFEQLLQVQRPAWALVTPEQAKALQAAQPAIDAQKRLLLPKYGDAQLIYLGKP